MDIKNKRGWVGSLSIGISVGILIGLLLGIIIGIVFQQALIIKVVEGVLPSLENMNIQVDVNETYVLDRSEELLDSFQSYLNETSLSKLKEVKLK